MTIFAFNTTRCFTHKLQAAQFAVNTVLSTYFTVRFKLNSSIMKFGSKIFTLTDNDYFFTHITIPTDFILVTVEKGDIVAVHDVHTEIYTSPSE